jgi:hypothetical protein
MSSRYVVLGFWLSFSGVAESVSLKSRDAPSDTAVMASISSTSNDSQPVAASLFSRDVQWPGKMSLEWADASWAASPYGWIRLSKDAHSPKLYHMHIPKTGGVSFARDMLRTLPSDVGIYSWEACYPTYSSIFANELDGQPRNRGGIVTMVRNPRLHVYSQYQMCFDSDWGKQEVAKSSHHGETVSFSKWLRHFRTFTTDDFNCYHPVNMQTRSFTCTEHNAHHETGKPNEKIVDVAIENMLQANFVGIMEYYQESFCLLHVQLELKLPSWCNCEDKEAWSSFGQTHEDHGLQKHREADLTRQDRVLLDEITKDDRVLYDAATTHFLENIKATEARLGVKILCKA